MIVTCAHHDCQATYATAEDGGPFDALCRKHRNRCDNCQRRTNDLRQQTYRAGHYVCQKCWGRTEWPEDLGRR